MASASPFAPGSPAGGASSLLSGASGIPPLDFKSSSSADGKSTSVFDSSGFTVNLGGAGGVSQSGLLGASLNAGQAAPWLIGAAVVVAGFMLWRRHRLPL